MIARVIRIRTRAYAKLTRALLRHLRGNGGVADARAFDLRSRRGDVLAKLVRAGRDPKADSFARDKVRGILIGSIGINDQVEAMLS